MSTISSSAKTPGTQLLPALVDDLAQSDPHRILYSITKARDPSDGFLDINAQSFARAVNRCAWYLQDQIRPGHDFPTITYMGPQDVVYTILVLACSKVGCVPLFNSLRNTLDVHLALFDQTHCDTLLLPTGFQLPVVQQILKARSMRVLEIPGLQYWLDDEAEPQPYPYTKTFEEARHEPLVILHSSGSTGMPKPITLTNGTLSPMEAFTALPSLGQEPAFPALCAGTRVYFGTPLFHSAGLCLCLAGCLYSGFTAVLSPFPVTASLADGVHVHGNVQYSVLIPATLMDLAKDPEYLKNLSRLKYLIFGGALLPQDVGDFLSNYVRLINCLGSTEAGVLPIQACDREDWPYLKVSPVLGHEYRHISGDLYEQVIVRDETLSLYQGVFSTFPSLKEWYMKDVYSPHPTKKDVWLYRGRTDDIISFTNGERINPYEMEGIIKAHPLVVAVLIVGAGRPQSSLLVETASPPQNKIEKDEMTDGIWPAVEDANRQCPSYGRIYHNMILFTSPDKPMLKTSKGTVQRQSTLELYKKELDELYESNDNHVWSPLEGYDGNTDDLERRIREVIKSVSTDINVDTLTLDSDLFESGLNSLQVTVISRALTAWLSSLGPARTVQPRMIYSSPTLSGLLTMVVDLTQDRDSKPNVGNGIEKIQEMYDSYIKELPLRESQPQDCPDDITVLLTGSTGSLGSYILDSLLRNPRISKIYCLTRGKDGLKRLQAAQSAKGLASVDRRVECLDANFSQPHFGLSTQEAYTRLLKDVTHIIHCAWKVDFNQSIDSFGSHIKMVMQMVDFSVHSSFGARIFFVSSIGAISNWHETTGQTRPIPEEIYDDFHVPQPIGYAQSKFIAERVLDTAAKRAGIPVTVCRVGQIAGPTTVAGIWPKEEWLPSAIASSKYMSKLPSYLGRAERVDWVPVDILAQIIVELALASHDKQQADAAVFHIVNPRETNWGKLATSVQKHLSVESEIELVPLEEWIQGLEAFASSGKDPKLNPAVKIIDYFRSLHKQDPIILDTTNAVNMSPSLTNMEAVHDEWMKNWMRQWSL
ncbi:hypothetical protein NPX13_g2342 [Xylaria arbuscula]|uniref:Carrier domain-containing protein n=1 Tax=Xylaria arbuscula TaxID=114810 RepID=A0A9W8NKW8_9PEZI|nr:hypothetical protein NPX13_g2342 [Xylaria arbuscula]